MPTNLDDTRLPLDGYRLQVVEKLKASGGPRRVRDILAEVDVMLNTLGLSRAAQRAFWERLHTDLDVLTEDLLPLLGKDAAAALSAIIEAAKADITDYLALVSP